MEKIRDKTKVTFPEITFKIVNQNKKGHGTDESEDNKNPNPDQPNNQTPDPEKDNITDLLPKHQNFKTFLIVGGIIASLILIVFMFFYFWKKKIVKKVNMLYSPEQKRKIILNNYSHPSKQVGLEELKKITEEWQITFSTFRSLDMGCGDIIHLLIKKKDNYLEKCLFSGQQSCLITVAVANILCSCLEGKDLDFARKILNNCEAMTEKKAYNLENCPDLQVFNDISQFPHRVECIKLVVRGLIKLVNA